jgi:hypothetical protein
MHTLSLAKVPHQYDKIPRRYMMVQHKRSLNYQLCDRKKERKNQTYYNGPGNCFSRNSKIITYREKN